MVIAEYGLPARALVLGRAAPDGTSVELEQVVETATATVGSFWIRGAVDQDRFETTLREQPPVYDARVTDVVADARLHRGQYHVDGDTPVERVLRCEGAVLEATGDDGVWSLLLEFPDSERFYEFHQSVTEDVAVELERVYGAQDPVATGESDTELTSRQRETLATAYREGYYDIPRRATLVDLAEEFDVSDQAVSERLRRGEAKLIRAALFED